MQQLNGRIKNGIESAGNTPLFLSNQITGVSEMTKKIISSSPASLKICSIELSESKNLTKKFWSKVDKSSSIDGCWLWKAKTVTYFGYGRIRVGKKTIVAHRVAWYLIHGVLPQQLLLHSCDNPKCVNPDHLREGTQFENMKDKTSRNRQQKGQSHPHSKLTESEVKEILLLLKKGVLQKEIAKKFNTVSSNISLINRRLAWRHIKI